MLGLRPRNAYNMFSSCPLKVQQFPFPSRHCVSSWNRPIRHHSSRSTAYCNLLQYSSRILNQTLARQLPASYSTSVTNSHSVQLVNNGRELLLNFNSDGDQGQSSQDMLFHATWLRYNCQCPACLFSSGQKMITPTDLVPSLIVETAEMSGTCIQSCDQ